MKAISKSILKSGAYSARKTKNAGEETAKLYISWAINEGDPLLSLLDDAATKMEMGITRFVKDAAIARAKELVG